jgi:hypothetical protein
VRPVAVPAAFWRLAGVVGVGVDGGDDPVGGDLAGDPPAPIGPIRTLGRLHVLACHQRQQRHRRLGLLVQLGVAQRRKQRACVIHQRRHQRIPCLGVVPVDLGLARGAVVMTGAHHRDLRGRAGHLAGHPPDRRHQLGDGVLGGDRISQDRGVHHPPPTPSNDPGLLHHPPDRLVDAMRPRRAGQPLAPIGQRGRMESLVVQGHPGRDLPAQVTPGRLRTLGIRQVMQRLQGKDRGCHRRGQRRAAAARGKQIRELRIGEHLPAMGGQEPEHAARRDQMPDQRRRVQQLPVCPLNTLHAQPPQPSQHPGRSLSRIIQGAS